MRPTARRSLPIACLLPLLTGCISYTVGQGAETIAPHEQTLNSTFNVVPGSLKDGRNHTPTRRPSMDLDWRRGLDDRSDIGIRVTNWSGAMFTWKRQLSRPDSSRLQFENRSRTAIMLGAGLINFTEHAAFEATLIHSSRWTPAGQTYGAIRAIQVVPLGPEVPHDDPVVGVAFGHLFGDRNRSIGPEIGVFYDRSALGLNTNRVIVVPAVVLRGQGIPGFANLREIPRYLRRR